MATERAAIALGCNLGDCDTTLEGALTQLDAMPGVRLLARSAWYRSAPVGPPQPNYLNGCRRSKSTSGGCGPSAGARARSIST
jgi:2-amino-4-hydroxy-6-hydroxymethyldihydropteridine diphosphokinase